MATKRSLEDDSNESKRKKQKSGFQVGPKNLPDGTYRRKVQKIKNRLIQTAKVKKDFAKVKARIAKENEAETTQSAQSRESQNTSLEPHPDRKALINTSENIGPLEDSTPSNTWQPRPRQEPYVREVRVANKRKKEVERTREKAARAQIERQKKVEDREKYRKAMAKARIPGKGGQRRLGRESAILFEKVKKLVGSRK